MANLTNYAEILFLKAVYKNDATARSEISAASIQAALVTATPGETTENIASASEVSGGSYARIGAAAFAALFPTPTGGSMSNTSDVAWPAATAGWGTVVGVVWVDNTTGKVWAYKALSSGLVVTSGSTVKWTTGGLTLEFA